jgi:hypothetical protein
MSEPSEVVPTVPESAPVASQAPARPAQNATIEAEVSALTNQNAQHPD